MDCLLIEPHLAAYVDGELDAASVERVELHLKDCRRCREAVRDMRLASAVLTQWHTHHPSGSVSEKVLERIRREGILPGDGVAELEACEARAAGRRRRVRFVGGVVAVAAALLVTIVLYRFASAPAEPQGPAAVRSVAELGRSAESLRSIDEAAAAHVAIDSAVARAWSERRPNVESIVTLEVASTLALGAKDSAGAGELGAVLRELSRSAGPRAAVSAAGWGSGFLSTSAAYADETKPVPPVMTGSPEPKTLLDEGVSLEALGDLESAVRKYQTAAADRVLSLRANILQANVEMKLGRADSALEALDRAFALTRPETFYREVVENLRARAKESVELKKQISDMQAKLAKAEHDFDVLSDVGGLQVKAGDVKGAEATYDRMVRTAGPGREREALRARLVRAWCRRELNRLGEAFEEFDKLVVEAKELYPEVSVLAHFERAKTLDLKGRAAQALDDYRALALGAVLTPGAFAAVQFQVGCLLAQIDRPAESAETFRSLDRPGLRDQPFARAALALARDSSAPAR